MSLARCHKVSRSQHSKATGHSESLGTSTPPWRHHEARWAHQGHWGHALPLGRIAGEHEPRQALENRLGNCGDWGSSGRWSYYDLRIHTGERRRRATRTLGRRRHSRSFHINAALYIARQHSARSGC